MMKKRKNVSHLLPPISYILDKPTYNCLPLLYQTFKKVYDIHHCGVSIMNIASV